MCFRLILFAAGLAVACSLPPAQAEVLAINSSSATSEQPIISGASGAEVPNEADGESVETESDLDRGTPAVVPQASTWTTALLSLAGLSP
jgi:hypothetical protein